MTSDFFYVYSAECIEYSHILHVPNAFNYICLVHKNAVNY